jgi:hypothetical protein
VGSVLKELFDTGKHGEGGSYVVEGIGKDSVPEICDFKVIDEVVQIEDRESFLMTRRLLTEEGLFVGGSAGSAVVGALKYLKSRPRPERALVVLPDSGNRYQSKVFNDAWMIEMGYLDRTPAATLGTAARLLKKTPGVPSVAPGAPAPAGARIAAIRTEGIGFDTLRGAWVSGKSVPADRVAFLQEDDTIGDLGTVVDGGKIAMVFEGGLPKFAFDAEDFRAFFTKGK